MEYVVRHKITETDEWTEVSTEDYKEACKWFNCKTAGKLNESSVTSMYAPDGSLMFQVIK